MLLSPAGNFCFTFNKEEESFTQWAVDPLVLEDQQDDNSGSVSDFLSALPDKKDSKLFSDMKDFFCYIQIEKGATALSSKLPIEDIPALFRALGFYPTDKEIDDIINEVEITSKPYIYIKMTIDNLFLKVKYSDYVNTGKLRVDLGLEECLKLFINHKPVRGEDISELKKVFKIIGKPKEKEEDQLAVGRTELINFLKTRGEIFKEKDFINCVRPLFGKNGSQERNIEDDEFYAMTEEEISYHTFTNDILKIPETIKVDRENLQIVLEEPVIKV